MVYRLDNQGKPVNKDVILTNCVIFTIFIAKEERFGWKKDFAVFYSKRKSGHFILGARSFPIFCIFSSDSASLNIHYLKFCSVHFCHFNKIHSLFVKTRTYNLFTVSKRDFQFKESSASKYREKSNFIFCFKLKLNGGSYFGSC